MVGSAHPPRTPLDGSDLSLALIRARFNDAITTKLREGAMRALQRHRVPETAILDLEVPGAVELALAAELAIVERQVDAVICLGVVIQGQTKHFDYVCKLAAEGIQRVSLNHRVPVAFGVLTVDTEEQALARVSAEDHRGDDAATAAVEMALLARALKRED